MALVVFPKDFESKHQYKALVLQKLWLYAKPKKADNRILSIQKCQELVLKFNTFGQVMGRDLNVSLKNFPFVTQIKYDNLNGHGRMQEVANIFNKIVLKRKQTNNIEFLKYIPNGILDKFNKLTNKKSDDLNIDDLD